MSIKNAGVIAGAVLDFDCAEFYRNLVRLAVGEECPEPIMCWDCGGETGCGAVWRLSVAAPAELPCPACAKGVTRYDLPYRELALKWGAELPEHSHPLVRLGPLDRLGWYWPAFWRFRQALDYWPGHLRWTIARWIPGTRPWKNRRRWSAQRPA